MKTSHALFVRIVVSPTVSLVVCAMFGTVTLAQAPAPKLGMNQAGFYRMQVGDIEIIALSDGTNSMNLAQFLTNAQPAEVESLLAYAYQNPALDASVNAYLIVAKPKLILVDAGSGELFGPSLNKLPTSLELAGYKAEQITDILLTHIHTAHSGGLIDGDRRVFPNAVVHVDKREIEFWLDTAKANKAEGNMKELYRQAFVKVKPYLDAGKVKTFDGDTQLFPGIRSVATPGHTPGHSFYVLESNGEKLVFWGDIMHVAEAQFPNPSITIMFDVDSKAAAALGEPCSVNILIGKTEAL